MEENNDFAKTILEEIEQVGNEVLQAQGAINDFAAGLIQEVQNNVVDGLAKVGESITTDGLSSLEQGINPPEAVAKGKNNKDGGNLFGMSDEQLENMKKIGAATLDAYNSISNSILEIKRNEAKDKMAIIDKELEHTLGALNKEKEERLIAAGFAVENNAQSLEAQLEAARKSGDEALAYELERRLQEKEINDEYDRLAEEANKAAA